MDNKVTVHKIPVGMLITLLTDLYEQGVDYIDIIGRNEGDIDHLGISISPDYVVGDEVEMDKIKFPEVNFILEKETPPPPPTKTPPSTTDKLNEDDLNDLI